MTASLFAAGFGLALFLFALEGVTHRRHMRALDPRPGPDPLPCHPSVTVIRPIKGLDPDAAENIRAGLDTGYPGNVQTLFLLDDASEPAVPLVQAAIDAHQRDGGHGSAEILYCGSPPPGMTGKLNAMIQGVAKAQGEVICFADSDIRTDRRVLRVLVETLMQTDRAGSVFAPVNVSEPARTLGDACCAILLNGLYTPPATLYARDHDGELPFILGQLMVVTRESLEAIGGLESVAGQLVDDLYIGQLMRSAGLRNIMATHPIRIIQYGLDRQQALAVCSRWFAFSRTGIPEWSFKWPIAQRAISVWLGGLGAAGFAVAGSWSLAALYGGLAAFVAASLGAVHHRVGAAPLRGLHRLAPLVTYLVAPWILLRVYFLRRVSWRGRDYVLDDDGRLDSTS